MVYLILKRCRVIDTVSGDDTVLDIGIDNGKVDAVGEVDSRKADKVVDVEGRYATPPLVDLHTHVYHLGTSLGVSADEVAARSATGVFVDAGSAGAGNFAGFKEHVIARSDSVIYSFLNIGFGGIPFFGIHGKSQSGEIPSIEVADEEACFDCADKNRRQVVGVKVRLSENANGELGVEPLKIAKRCARRLGLPVMVHFGRPPPRVEEIADLLQRGDILTHSFRPEPNSILSDGSISPALQRARSRGVLIDVGHGGGSFSYETASEAMANGFFPDTISTDIHAFSTPEPVYDLETTMTKFLNLGMDMNAVIRAATSTPAIAIDRPQHAKIEVGRKADIAILEVARLRTTLKDATGKQMTFSKAIRPVLRVKGGNVSEIPWRKPGLG